MNIFFTIGTVIWKLWFYTIAIVITFFFSFIVLLFSFKESHFITAYFFIRIWAKIIYFGSGMRYQLFADKELTSQPHIIISNHTSVLDILLMIILHPNNPLTFVGKKELVKIPLFGIVYKRLAVMVDRKSIRSKARVYELSKEKIELGRSMVVFPEGGVSDDTSIVLDKFKDGAFSIAKDSNVPLAVYTFDGLKESFPFNFWKGKPATIKVYLETIIQPNKKDDNNIKKLSFDLIEKRLLKKF